MNNDTVYNIRMHFNHGNAINLELKGCGTLYIKPGKDYFFTNAPINFVNYLAQLRRLGVTYEMTDNKKGCYQTIDLRYYNISDPRYIMANLRKPIEVKQETKKTPKEEKVHVVLSSDDNIKVVNKETVESEGISVTELFSTIPSVEETNNKETPETNDLVIEEPQKAEVENKIYSEDELSKMGKTKLLEIAQGLGIESVSNINTKKEIREAIIATQNK